MQLEHGNIGASASIEGVEWAENDPIIGTNIGRYRLQEHIGEGGFGDVYLAEQTEPVKRKVALKILKGGMDTKQVISRFRSEQQALARLDSANIAKIFDGGTTGAERPYFVMEYVDGAPITQHCDELQFGVNDRVKLMVAVCRSVEHAHLRGIVHRDLKPSNILVTSQPGEETQVKVIDFGIAKATSDPLTTQTFFTKMDQFVGSPEYMSPEQLNPEATIDHRSDVFALGTLLYELLTGVTPHGEKIKTKSAHEAASEITTEIPCPPSKRNGKPRRGNIGTQLDAIVLKALEKSPEQRYQRVEELAADLESYLAGGPVSAKALGIGFHLRRLTKVNGQKIAVAVGALAIALMFALVILQGRGQDNRERSSNLAQNNFTSRSRAPDNKLVPVSLFQFDGNLDNSMVGKVPPMRVVGEPRVAFETVKIGGADAEVLRFPAFLIDQYLTTDNPIGPNGHAQATDTNEYTVVMDIMFLELPGTTPLVQASVGNSGGAELSVYQDGKLGDSFRAHRKFRIGKWHRVGYSVSVRGETQLVLCTIDGKPSGQQYADGKVDSHCGLNEEIHFFCTGRGSTSAGYVNSIALYDVPLTTAELESLGGPTAEGIPEEIDLSPGASDQKDIKVEGGSVIVPPEGGESRETYVVSVDAKRLLVATYTFTGKTGGAWIYEDTGTGGEKDWKLAEALEPGPDHVDAWAFGKSAALVGDWAAVSADSEAVNGRAEAGALHLYKRSETGTWKRIQRITSSSPTDGEFFGEIIAMSDGLLAVAEKNRDKRYRIHLYSLDENDSEPLWTFEQMIESELASPLGISLAKDVVVLRQKGDLIVFHRESGLWNKVEGIDGKRAISHMTDGRFLIVGARPRSPEEAGVVYLYRHVSIAESGLQLEAVIAAPDEAWPGHFGTMSTTMSKKVAFSYQVMIGERSLW